MGMVTRTVRLAPVSYSIWSGTGFSNLDNALTDVDSSTYAIAQNTDTSTTKTVFFTFDYTAIPDGATISSFEFKAKVQNNISAQVQVSLRRSNATDTTKYFNQGTSTQTLTPTGSFTYYKNNGYGMAFGSTGNNKCDFYIYGSEMDVTYTAFEPDTHGIFNLILPRG